MENEYDIDLEELHEIDALFREEGIIVSKWSKACTDCSWVGWSDKLVAQHRAKKHGDTQALVEWQKEVDRKKGGQNGQL